VLDGVDEAFPFRGRFLICRSFGDCSLFLLDLTDGTRRTAVPYASAFAVTDDAVWFTDAHGAHWVQPVE
jgi:hypothetical protein